MPAFDPLSYRLFERLHLFRTHLDITQNERARVTQVLVFGPIYAAILAPLL